MRASPKRVSEVSELVLNGWCILLHHGSYRGMRDSVHALWAAEWGSNLEANAKWWTFSKFSLGNHLFDPMVSYYHISMVQPHWHPGWGVGSFMVLGWSADSSNLSLAYLLKAKTFDWNYLWVPCHATLQVCGSRGRWTKPVNERLLVTWIAKNCRPIA